MFWDIALPVLAALAQGLTGFLGWRVTVDGVRRERKRVYEIMFASASLIGILAVGIAAYRGSQLTRDLADLKQGQQTTNAGISKIENVPPPIINVPPATVQFLPSSPQTLLASVILDKWQSAYRTTLPGTTSPVPVGLVRTSPWR